MKNVIILGIALGNIMTACQKPLNSNLKRSIFVSNAQNFMVRGGVVASNDSAFKIVAYAGSGIAGSSNGTSGNPKTAQFNAPEGIAFDSHGNLFIADRNNEVIRKVTPAGAVSVFAGKLGTSGYVNGTGTAARFNYPIRLAIDGADNIYVADRNNARIRKITPSSVVTTIAGSTSGSGATQFNWPIDVAVTGDGSKIYVADAHNNRIQKIIYSGGTYTTSLLAGQPTAGYAGGNGAAAKFNNPSGVAIDANGNVLVADRYNNCIRRITSARNVYRVAGVAGVSGNLDAPNGLATFNQPFSVTVANDGCIYVGDIGNHNIRRFNDNGPMVLTVAGNDTIGSATGDYSSFNQPTSIAIDNSGNFFVADGANHFIRKMVPVVRVLQITNGWTQSTPYSGITWFKYSGNDFFSPTRQTNKIQMVNVFDIDLSINHLSLREVADGHRTSLTSIIGSPTDAIAALSGTFTTEPAGIHAAYLRIEDSTYWSAAIPSTSQYWKYHEGVFYMNSEGLYDINKSNMAQDPFNPALHENMISGYPLLIYNSQAYVSPYLPAVDSAAARSVIAIPIVNNHILLINAEGLEPNKPVYYSPRPTYYGLSFKDLTQFLQQFFHVKSALNLDGGGSSTMCLKGYGDNGDISGGLGVINFPAYDSSNPPPGTSAYDQQRAIGDAIAVVPN